MPRVAPAPFEPGHPAGSAWSAEPWGPQQEGEGHCHLGLPRPRAAHSWALSPAPDVASHVCPGSGLELAPSALPAHARQARRRPERAPGQLHCGHPHEPLPAISPAASQAGPSASPCPASRPPLCLLTSASLLLAGPPAPSPICPERRVWPSRPLPAPAESAPACSIFRAVAVTTRISGPSSISPVALRREGRGARPLGNARSAASSPGPSSEISALTQGRAGPGRGGGRAPQGTRTSAHLGLQGTLR